MSFVKEDLRGRVFGRATVVDFAPSRGGQTRWLCQCLCGKRWEVARGPLLRGRTTSCGCYKGGRNRRHGEAAGRKRSNELRTYYAMRSRCLNPQHDSFGFYGGRGISICARWLDKKYGYKNFLLEVGRMPGPGYTLDRYPNKDGNYEPGNVRWATAKQQANNTRRNHVVNYKGTTFTVAQLLEAACPDARKRPTATVRFYARLRRGWSIEEAVDLPAVGRGRADVRPQEVRDGL